LTKFKLSKQAYDTLFNRCGLPAFIFLKNKGRAMKVGIGMVSKGEVGLIVAGVGVSSGALSAAIYTTVIIMDALTTIVTPIWLKIAYREEEGKLDWKNGHNREQINRYDFIVELRQWVSIHRFVDGHIHTWMDKYKCFLYYHVILG
jgi:hypothetical protein